MEGILMDDFLKFVFVSHSGFRIRIRLMEMILS